MFDMQAWRERVSEWFRTAPKVAHRPRGRCPVCRKDVSILKDGTLAKHKHTFVQEIQTVTHPIASNPPEMTSIVTHTGGQGEPFYIADPLRETMPHSPICECEVCLTNPKTQSTEVSNGNAESAGTAAVIAN